MDVAVTWKSGQEDTSATNEGMGLLTPGKGDMVELFMRIAARE